MTLIILIIALGLVMAIPAWRQTFFLVVGALAANVIWLLQNLFQINPPGWLLQFATLCGQLAGGAFRAARIALGVLSWVLIALSICIFAAISFGSEESLAIIMILLLAIFLVLRWIAKAASSVASPLSSRWAWLAGIDTGVQNTLHSACLGVILIGCVALFLGDSMGEVITFRMFLMGILLVALLGLSGWFNVGRGPGKLVPAVVIGMFLIMVLPTPIKDFARGLGRHAGAALNSGSTSHQRGVPNLETNAQLTLAEVTEEATLYVVSGDRVSATMTITAGTQLACLNPQPSTQKFGLEPMLELALPGPNGEFVQLGTTGWVVARKVRLMGPIHSTDSATASGSTLPLPTKKSFSWTLGVNIAMLLTGLAIVAFVLTALSLLISSGKERVSAAKLLAALAIVIIIGFAAVTVLADLSPEAASSAGGPGLIQTASAAQLPSPLQAPKLPSTQPAAAAPVRAANTPANLVELANRYADQHRLERELVYSIIAVESAWDPRAVSTENAQGLMQLVPATQRRFGVRNAFDPEANVAAGTEYLRWLLDRYHGDVTTALIGYHSGEGEADKYVGKRLDLVLDQLKPRAKQYVPLVLGHWASLKSAGGATAQVAAASPAPTIATAEGSNHTYEVSAAAPTTINLAFASGQRFVIAVSGKAKRSGISPWADCSGEAKTGRQEKDSEEFLLPEERIMLPVARINGRWQAVGCSATFAGPATVESLWVNGRAHAPARYNMTALQRGELEFRITN